MSRKPEALPKTPATADHRRPARLPLLSGVSSADRTGADRKVTPQREQTRRERIARLARTSRSALDARRARTSRRAPNARSAQDRRRALESRCVRSSRDPLHSHDTRKARRPLSKLSLREGPQRSAYAPGEMRRELPVKRGLEPRCRVSAGTFTRTSTRTSTTKTVSSK